MKAKGQTPYDLEFFLLLRLREFEYNMILFPLLIFLHFRFRSSIASQDSLELPSGIALPPPQVSQSKIYPKKVYNL